MIPYTLIIPSASRPHLLVQVLDTLFKNIDQFPVALIVHDDAVFPERRAEMDDVLTKHVPVHIPWQVKYDDPPIFHGPALKWLLDHVKTEYVLYSQDDHKVKRPLPIRDALAALHQNNLNQIRFNKRDTQDKKGREGEEFYKIEHTLVWTNEDRDTSYGQVCAADHWYFQTGLWRVAAIKPVVDWWFYQGPGAFTEHMEVKINQVFNGQWNHLVLPEMAKTAAPILRVTDGAWNDPAIRARIHKTFIWGKVGEPAFLEHVGTAPEDWAAIRANRDPVRNI